MLCNKWLLTLRGSITIMFLSHSWASWSSVFWLTTEPSKAERMALRGASSGHHGSPAETRDWNKRARFHALIPWTALGAFPMTLCLSALFWRHIYYMALWWPCTGDFCRGCTAVYTWLISPLVCWLSAVSVYTSYALCLYSLEWGVRLGLSSNATKKDPFLKLNKKRKRKRKNSLLHTYLSA